MFQQDKSLGFLEGWISIFLNTILFLLKLWVGFRVHSVAMVADAWHTLADSFTSLIVIVGFWMSVRPADKKHHFGHGRAEAVGALIIGTLLGVVAFSFLKDSIARLLQHSSVKFELFGIIVFLISVFVKEALAQFAFWAGRKIHSRSLLADAWHHRSDAIASGFILIGATLGRQWWWMDGVLGIGVSLLILYATVTIIRNAASYLIGESPSPDLKKKINDMLRDSGESSVKLHHLHFHDYGPHREITVHIHLPGEMSVGEAHTFATRIERLLREKLQLEATIHIDPARKRKERID